MRTSIVAVLLLAVCASAAVFEEKFDDSWEKRWKISDWKKGETQGKWEISQAITEEHKDEVGLKTSQDARFYNAYAELDKEFNNEGKDLVLQYSVKYTETPDCGGAYIKLVPSSSKKEMKNFGGDTPYAIMFGPDVCGHKKEVHAILNYKGENHLIKKQIDPVTDKLTHLYTFVLSPNNTYKVLIDQEEKASGSLYEDWDFLPPKTIPDPDAKKPEDWDERAKIPDPEDKKPEGYDDIPEKIVDPKATKPDDWDDEEDGEWEAPLIDNPEYKGEWKPKMIDNPDYKGIWTPPEIDNPNYKHDDKLYLREPLKYVGFELWQVKSGSLFDNILVTESLEEANKVAAETWAKLRDVEQAAVEKAELEAAKAAEEAAKKAAAEKMEREDDDEDEDDDEEEEVKGADKDATDKEEADDFEHEEL